MEKWNSLKYLNHILSDLKSSYLIQSETNDKRIKDFRNLLRQFPKEVTNWYIAILNVHIRKQNFLKYSYYIVNSLKSLRFHSIGNKKGTTIL